MEKVKYTTTNVDFCDKFHYNSFSFHIAMRSRNKVTNEVRMKSKKLWYRMIAILLCICLMISWFTPSVLAAEMTDIRVGLVNFYKGKPTLSIKTTKIGLGYSVNDSYSYEAVFASNSGFTFTPATGYYYVLAKKFTSYESALKMAKRIQSIGVDAKPVSIYRNYWKVYVGGEKDLDKMSAIKKKLKSSFEDTYYGPYQDNGHRVQMSGDGVSILLDANGANAYPQFKAITVNKEKVAVIDLGARSYRGRIEIGRYGKSTLTAVNIVNIESYLYGVVPSEMTSSWPSEALKAQAVCARSYAISKTSYGTDSNIITAYQLSDTTSSQVYKGYKVETTATNAAVNATKNLVVLYENKVIPAYYYSTSGGKTADVRNVWGIKQPFLKSVVDEYETEPEKTPWVIAMTKAELLGKLKESGHTIGSVRTIIPQIMTSSGRVYTLQVMSDNNSVILKSEKIRTVLDLYSTKFKVVSYQDNSDAVVALGAEGKADIELNSSYVIDGSNKVTALNDTKNRIYIVKSADNLTPFIKDSPNKESVFYFVGLGYGHGVGMSQSGAKGMAKKGYSFREIIQYYFQGSTVSKFKIVLS